MDFLTCAGILICLAHSALFSGVNLGFFGLSRLRLEVEAELKKEGAQRILELRRDSHFLLSTILWGNVMSNVLLALLSESILSGVGAFVFSTFVITIIAEILPQAYFSRHILNISVLLIPFIKLYQVVLYPIAKPTAILLDRWLGKETPGYFSEEAMKMLLKKHAIGGKSQISMMESIGAINFLNLDDVKVEEIGSTIDPKSVISLPVNDNGLPAFQHFDTTSKDVFMNALHASGKRWLIITDLSNRPRLVMDAASFLQYVCFKKENMDIISYCRRPFVVTEIGRNIGHIIGDFRKTPGKSMDGIKVANLILFWTEENKRIITGTDLLNRLLKGIMRDI